MPEDFKFDVFLSYGSKDRAVVPPLAKRPRETAGLRLWFEKWVLKPGDSIPAKIEEGLEYSRVLVLGMSAGNQSTLRLVKRSGVTDVEAKVAVTFACYRRTFAR